MTTNKHFFTIVLGAVAALSISSCQDFDAVDEEAINRFKKEEEFSKNFVFEFGEMDPNHTWGFEGIAPSVINGVATRAVVNIDNNPALSDIVVNTNTNEWALANAYFNLTERGITIPGWPNDDSKYYTTNGIKATIGDINYSSDYPIGDVTAEEINIVSEFFRYNNLENNFKSGKTCNISYSGSKITNAVVGTKPLSLANNFFIQNISRDFDRKSYPDGDRITNSDDINLENKHENIDYKMDQLLCKSSDKWQHIMNFNASKTCLVEDRTNTQYREIKYVESNGITDFAFHSSFDDEQRFFDDYVLVELTWKETMSDGAEHVRTGKYLAFDYEAIKTSSGTTIKPDGYYSNWIVKLTSATATHRDNVQYTKRVMCEDLGNTHDFDFNDVVFDVNYEVEDKNCYAVITLQAVGGTLPISVGFNEFKEDYEAHKLLGFSSKTPINVVSGGAIHTPVSYRILVDTNYTDGKTYNPEEIPVVVKGQSALNSKRQNLSSYGNGEKGTQIAPQKFCTNTNVRWMKECKHIGKTYTQFASWVQNESNYTTWYETIENSNNLWP